MANKVLEKTLSNIDPNDLKAGYAAPSSFDSLGNPISPPPSVFTNTDSMSVTGAARAALVLFAILVATGTWAWISIPESAWGMALFVSIFAALGVGLLTTFKPNIARVSAPIYAAIEGVAIGLISRVYENAYNGIVIQAVLATGAIVFVMYSLYSMRIIKVTQRFTRIVIGATMAIFVFYMANLLFSIFNVNLPLINDTGIAGIIFSAVVICIAAANLAIDFSFIESGVQQGLPKYMNWAAAYGLVVTIVWIYLEVLRLLAKSRN
ncbi:MAG: Bax inhibitor-1/YccA family protein [Acidimicrobiia bacterium]